MVPRQGWWVKNFFSQTQRQECLDDGSDPATNRRLVLRLFRNRHPVGHLGNGLADEGIDWLGSIKAGRPAANRGWIRLAVGVLELRHCLFPRAVLHKAQQQCLAARQQAVMRIRKRKHRKKSEGRSASHAAAPANSDPVMMLVVRLLAAVSVTDDRIAVANRTMA